MRRFDNNEVAPGSAIRFSLQTVPVYLILVLLLGVSGAGCTKDSDMDNEFAMAAKHGDMGKVQALLQRGVNVDGVDRKFGATALMWAAHEGHTDVVRLLLDSGATIDAQQSLGRTALWYTAQQGRRAAAEILIAAGANVDLAAKDGTTPRDIALERGHPEIAELLTKAETPAPE